jgi:ABC-2 type transport system permease protein
MNAFLVHLRIQFASDLRDKGVLMVYYLVPLVFYAVMGSILKTLATDMNGDDTTGSLSLALNIFALSMSAFLGMPAGLVKAREQGVLEAFRAAGIPAWSLPLTTLIISTLHILVVSCVIVFTAPFLLSTELPRHLVAYFVTVVMVAISSEALGALIACLVKKQNTMTLVSQCLFMPTILFSGIMFPANLLPKPVQWLGEALPATQGIHLFAGGHLLSWPMALLAGTAAAAFAVSALLFRRISQRH